MKAPSLDLFVFADALGWTQVEKRSFLADLFPFRAPCDTVFGYSASCDPSILTGALPAQHGHFSFFVFDPKNSPFRWARHLGWLPEPVAAHHRIRNRVSRWVAARNGYTGYFQLYSVPFGQLPWFDYTEKRDIYLPGGINGGQPVIFDHWEKSGIPWTRSDWRAGDVVNIAKLKSEIDRADVASPISLPLGSTPPCTPTPHPRPRPTQASRDSGRPCARSMPWPNPATARCASTYSAITA